jgi:uncharacterized membrane protein
MPLLRARAISTCLSFGAASNALAAPIFVWLGDLPGEQERSGASAIAEDGSVVVGSSVNRDGVNRHEAFHWTADEEIGLGHPDSGSSFATDTTADGMVVVGS